MALKKNLLKGEGEGADILFALLQMHAVQNIRTLAFFLTRSAKRTLLKTPAPSLFSFAMLVIFFVFFLCIFFRACAVKGHNPCMTAR